MNITDEIRNYQPVGALPPEQHKTCDEYYVLAMLKYAFPDRFSKLHKSESPDLQDEETGLGIEVTRGGSPQNELIAGVSYKYSLAKTDKERQKLLQIIRKNGGDRDQFSTSFPVGTSEGDKRDIKHAFRKKPKKIESYKKKFRYVGIVIMTDIPLCILNDPNWGDWLSEINQHSQEQYDFVALLHWAGIEMYDFQTKEYSRCRVDGEERDILKKLARMTTEGYYKDDDPVWN